VQTIKGVEQQFPEQEHFISMVSFNGLGLKTHLWKEPVVKLNQLDASTYQPIVENPEKFIGEKDLKLVARQYRVGSYIFDLLFEDRHGSKLIVEIQKGTLDRTHTYKILDYYHEYKENNPKEFIDIMVVANVIPTERKRRLSDLGVAYLEISESSFVRTEDKLTTTGSEYWQLSPQNIDKNSEKKSRESARQYFKSKGPSAFISAVAEELKVRININWSLKGEASLIVRHIPTIKAMEREFG
jgi:hypothetical protein